MSSSIDEVLEISEDILNRTASVIKKLSPNSKGRISSNIEVFPVENSVVLRKKNIEGSSDVEIIVIEHPEAINAIGGFSTESVTKTFKNKKGDGFIETSIIVHLAPESDINMIGLERSLQVLCEGYVRSLEALYVRASGLI